MMVDSRLVSWLPLSITLAWFVTMVGCSPRVNEYVPPPPAGVTVMTPIKQTITRYIEENGQIEAVERAEVRARVRGFIEAIEFEPGQTVDVDTLLYQIEDDEYQAALNSLSAEVAAAEAAISVAESQVLTAQAEADRAARELTRQETLLRQQSTSQTEYDQSLAADEGAKAMLAAARSAVDSAQAVLKQARAKQEKAQLDLSYTRVKAPIVGRVTKTDLKLGNLVEIGTELAAVVNDSKVYANFSISDRQLLELKKARDESDNGRVTQDQWSSVPVYLGRETDAGFPFEGRLNYVDQEGVDAVTGTLSLRAIFDNPERKLLAGLFVRVRMPVAQQPDALVIPARAILQDRIGAFVLVAGQDNQVARRDVQISEQREGWSVVSDGLSETDQVVVEGLQRARPGAPVQPTVQLADVSDLPPSFRTPVGPQMSTAGGSRATLQSDVEAETKDVSP